MFAFLGSLAQNRRLLVDFVARDLKARYVGSSMGFFWSVIFPVINLFVYMFVFRLVLKTRWSDHQGTEMVALLMLVGIIVWQAFAESMSRTTNCLPESQNLIQRVVFPSEVLPVYLIVSSLVNMLIGLAVALGGVVWFAYVRPVSAGPVDARPVAFAVQAATGDAQSPHALTRAFAFRCASNPAQTHYGAGSVVDASAENAWKLGAAEWGPGAFAPAGWGDYVFAQSGEWAIATEKTGYSMGVDHWRDARGEACPPPKDGVQALIAGPPEPGLAVGVPLICLPLLVLLQGVFMLGLGSFLATLNLYVRDTYHVIGVATTVWMFATPIFYPERLVRDAGYGWILDVNPMHWLIHCYRDVMVYGAWPSWSYLGMFAAAGFVVLAAGSSVFVSQKARFADLL